jgi:hypothetical protein
LLDDGDAGGAVERFGPRGGGVHECADGA